MKKALVIDSSVAVKWLNSKDELMVDTSNTIMEHTQEEKVILLMPELAKYEIANALLYKGLTLELLQTSLEDFYYLPIKFFPEDITSSELTIKIAYESAMSYYDASFIALAKQHHADLITANPKHHTKYKGKDIRIISLEKYK